MASVTETLAKPVGPLPLGGWLAAIGAGVGIALYNRSRGTKTPTEDYVDTGTDPGVGRGPGLPGIIPPGGGFIPYQPVPVDPETGLPTSPTVPGTTTPAPGAPREYADNDAWGKAALAWAIGAGHNPVTATFAIRKYMDGGEWNQPEDVIIRGALQALGPPPIIPIGGTYNPPPVVVPVPVPTVPGIPNPGPLPPTTPLPIPPGTPKPPTPGTGKWLAIPGGFVVGSLMGSSHVFDKVATSHGYPAVTKNGKVVNRLAIDKIWYHATNAPIRKKYNNDWTKLRAGDTIWIPYK